MAAFTYPRSEPGSSGHLDLVERLNANMPALRVEVAGLPHAALSYRPADDAWSIKEVCGHLRDDAQFLHRRLYVMIKLEDPYLEPYDEQALIRERNPQVSPIDELLNEFTSKRAETVDMLAELVHWNWARTGRHGELGRISIRQLVAQTIAHDEGHLEQIRRLKEQARGG